MTARRNRYTDHPPFCGEAVIHICGGYMKRFITIAFLFLLFIITPAGCARNAAETGGALSVVCTTFPQYDWARELIGENIGGFTLTLLQNNRIDLHNYQPTIDDIVKISTCDLFIYVGGESDGWADDALKGATNKKMIVINLLDALGDAAKTEELVEGMEADGGDGDGPDYDEHVWLSLRNAKIFCSVIAGALASLDENNGDVYAANLAAYLEKLSALDAEYMKAVAAAPLGTLLFGDRFPFRYLTDDYGLDYYAAFAGCSAETEAGFDTIIFLANIADELGLNSVVVTESSDKKIAETIIRESGDTSRRILAFDSMQSATAGDAQGGTTYLSIMENNLAVLEEALR